MVTGRELCLWACSFWELIGRKKALDVSEGTWLRLARFRVRAEGSPEAVMDSRFAAMPESLLSCVALPDFDFEEPAVLLVSGRTALFLLVPVCGLASPASPLSRDDITLGAAGAADLEKSCVVGKPSASPDDVGRPDAMVVVEFRLLRPPITYPVGGDHQLSSGTWRGLRTEVGIPKIVGYSARR